MTEEWRPVSGFEGLYEVSNSGTVRSLTRTTKTRNRWGEMNREFPGRILSGGRTPRYLQVVLYRDGKSFVRTVHSIVAEAFLGARPPGKLVCHRDDNGQNASANNLYHGTPADNTADAIQNGRFPVGERRYNAKLTSQDVEAIIRLSENKTQRELATEFGVVQGVIGHILRGRSWAHVLRPAPPVKRPAKNLTSKAGI